MGPETTREYREIVDGSSSPDTIKQLLDVDDDSPAGMAQNFGFSFGSNRGLDDPDSLKESTEFGQSLLDARDKIYQNTQTALSNMPDEITVYRMGEARPGEVQSYTLDPNMPTGTLPNIGNRSNQSLEAFTVNKKDILAYPNALRLDSMSGGIASEAEVLIRTPGPVSSKVPTRKEIADVGVSMGEAKKAGDEETFQSLKAQQDEMKARFDEANPKQQKVERPATSDQAIVRMTDSEYVEETGQYVDIPGTKIRANVLNGIETIPADQGTGKQFLRGIREGGVSEREMRNSGLGSFLQQNMDRLLTKEQVREEYLKYAPRLRTRDMGQSFYEEQRIMKDESVDYRVMRFENDNPNVGRVPEFLSQEPIGAFDTGLAHFGTDGDVGYVRMADLDGSYVPGAQPNNTYILVNEVQDDLNKTRSKIDSSKNLDKRMEERSAASPDYIRETIKTGQKHLKVFDEALDELSRIDPQGKKYGVALEDLTKTRDALKKGIQDASEETADDGFGRLSASKALILDSRLETLVRNKMSLFTMSKEIQDDGFSPEVARRVSDLISGNSYTADKAFASARKRFKDAHQSVKRANENEVIGSQYAEMTPDIHRKLTSPETSKLFQSITDARSVLKSASNDLESAKRSKRDSSAIRERIRLLESDIKRQEDVVKASQKEVDEAGTATREERLQGIVAKAGLGGAKDGLFQLNRQLEGARQTLQEIFDETPQIEKRIAEAEKAREAAEGKLDMSLETLRSRDPELSDLFGKTFIPNRVGDSDETHIMMFDTVLEDAISNSSKNGVILPSPKIIAAERGEEASSFEPIYGKLAKQSVEKFQKRYPNVDVRTIDEADHPLEGSTVITFPSPSQREATEVLTHKYAQGGMVYKGIGSMGREVL